MMNPARRDRAETAVRRNENSDGCVDEAPYCAGLLGAVAALPKIDGRSGRARLACTAAMDSDARASAIAELPIPPRLVRARP